MIDSGTGREREFQAELFPRDRAKDLALLKFQYAPKSVLDFNDTSAVSLGERLWVAGFPFGDLLSRERQDTMQDEVNPSVTVSPVGIDLLTIGFFKRCPEQRPVNIRKAKSDVHSTFL